MDEHDLQVNRIISLLKNKRGMKVMATIRTTGEHWGNVAVPKRAAMELVAPLERHEITFWMYDADDNILYIG